MCLSCGVKSTVDLCDKPECCAQEIGTDLRDDLVTPHLPSHDVFKVRAAIHPFMEFGTAHRAAMEALKTARKIMEDAGDHQPLSARTEAVAATEIQPEQPRKSPKCAKCGDPVSQPCWYCVDCRGTPRSMSRGTVVFNGDCDPQIPSPAAASSSATPATRNTVVSRRANTRPCTRSSKYRCTNPQTQNER